MSILSLHRRRADSCLSRVWHLSDGAAYIHVCTNETINGCQFHFTPDTGSAPLVADMSSEILSRPVDFSIYDVVFASAQKNLGPAGVTLLIVREDLIGYASPFCPSVFDWKNVVESDSMFNTPPTYAIYICSRMKLSFRLFWMTFSMGKIRISLWQFSGG